MKHMLPERCWFWGPTQLVSDSFSVHLPLFFSAPKWLDLFFPVWITQHSSGALQRHLSLCSGAVRRESFIAPLTSGSLTLIVPLVCFIFSLWHLGGWCSYLLYRADSNGSDRTRVTFL